MKFDEELQKIGNPSGWSLTLLLLMSSPTVCYVILYTIFAKITSPSFKTRCRISQLEHKNWSFEQVQRISAPLNKNFWNCTYFKYNYTALATMDYEEALAYVEGIEDPEIAFCKKFVHKGCNGYSLYEEFSLVCRRSYLEEHLNISVVFGQVTAGALLVPLGDIMGRKCVLKWGANLFIASGLLMCLANTVEILIVARMLIGMAYTLMIHPLQAIIVEISNVQSRWLNFVLMHMGVGLGFIIISVIATKIWHWRLLLWTVSSSLLILPLITWYVPESPRFFVSKGKMAKAWAMLKTVKQPSKQSYLLLYYRNERRYLREEIQMHLTELKPLILKICYLMGLALLVGFVYFKNFIVRLQIKIHISRSEYFLLSGIAEIISYLACLPLLLTGERKVVMVSLFSISGVSYLVVLQLGLGTANSLVFLIISELCTSALYLMLLLYINEVSPTSHRCTLTGLTCGFGMGISTIILFYLYNYVLSDSSLLIVLSCACFTGIPLAVFVDETQRKPLCDTIEEALEEHEN